MRSLPAMIVGPGYWLLISMHSISLPSGLHVDWVMSRSYYKERSIMLGSKKKLWKCTHMHGFARCWPFCIKVGSNAIPAEPTISESMAVGALGIPFLDEIWFRRSLGYR